MDPFTELSGVVEFILITGTVGLVALACFGILLTTWLLNRRIDPRHAKPPSDAR